MITNQIAVEINPQQSMLHQSYFWLQILDGWEREIGTMVKKCEWVSASSQVTAEVAKAAGELSVFGEKLDELRTVIDTHRVNLPVAEFADQEHHVTHSLLFERLSSESERLRDLLSELFKLNKEAYKRFLC